MNQVYPEFGVRLSTGTLDVSTATWQAIPVDMTAVFDPTDVVLGDLGAVTIGAGAVIALDSVTNDNTAASYNTSGTVTFTDITSADDVLAFVIFANDGVDDVLAAWIDTRADTTPVAFVGTGDDVDVEFPFGWFMRR